MGRRAQLLGSRTEREIRDKKPRTGCFWGEGGISRSALPIANGSALSTEKYAGKPLRSSQAGTAFWRIILNRRFLSLQQNTGYALMKYAMFRSNFKTCLLIYFENTSLINQKNDVCINV